MAIKCEGFCSDNLILHGKSYFTIWLQYQCCTTYTQLALILPLIPTILQHLIILFPKLYWLTIVIATQLYIARWWIGKVHLQLKELVSKCELKKLMMIKNTLPQGAVSSLEIYLAISCIYCSYINQLRKCPLDYGSLRIASYTVAIASYIIIPSNRIRISVTLSWLKNGDTQYRTSTSTVKPHVDQRLLSLGRLAIASYSKRRWVERQPRFITHISLCS